MTETDDNLDYSPRGEWKTTGGQKYLELIAPNNYELGKLEGKFLKKYILRFKDIISVLAKVFTLRGMSYNKFKKLAFESLENMERMAEKYPKFGPLLEEMRGMAEVIPSVTFEDIILQNYFIEIVYGTLIPNKRMDLPPEFDLGCTCFGSYTHEGKPIIAQNFDFNSLTQTAACFVLSILPDKPLVFSFRLGAMLSLPVARTSNGIRMCVSVVKTTLPSWPIVGTGIRTRYGLENLTKANEFYRLLKEEDDSIGYTLLIADDEELFALEITGYGIKKKNIDKVVVNSNTFITPELQPYLFKKKYSKKRQALGERLLAEAYMENEKGVTEDQLFNIMTLRPKICRNTTACYISPSFFGIGKPSKKVEKRGSMPCHSVCKEEQNL